MLSGATALTARVGGSPMQAYEIIDRLLAQQARLRAYVDDFQYLAAVCFLCIPIVFLLRKVVTRKGAVSAAH
jgi:DHA2 family multidrug resistance protein